MPKDAAVAPSKRTNAPKNGHAPLTFDHLQSKKKPITHRVPVHPDSELVDAYNQAAQAFESMRLTAEADLERARTRVLRDANAEKDEVARQEEIRQQYLAARKAFEDDTLYIIVRSCGRKRYDRIVAEHPPTDEDDAQFKELYGTDAKCPYHFDTFAPALVAACAIEPEMTYEQAMSLFEGEYEREPDGTLKLGPDNEPVEISPPWNTQEVSTLFGECLAVCNLSHIGTVGKGYGLTASS
jgi:hypothetical protein